MSTERENTEDNTSQSSEGEAREQRRGAKRMRARTPQLFDTPEVAAAKLGLDVQALRARCRRAATRVGNDVVAALGGGITAFKFGKSWRFRFPSP